MSGNLAVLLYLAAGILFILALRGLSSPATSRQGNLYGMIGMGVAVGTTLLLRLPTLGALILILIGAGAGGGVGAYVAKHVEMTKMPQLVAFFHSLVGLAAVLVAGSAFFAPQAFGIGAPGPHRRRQPVRNVARRGDRRHHLHRLGHRLSEARRAHERQADPARLSVTRSIFCSASRCSASSSCSRRRRAASGCFSSFSSRSRSA